MKDKNNKESLAFDPADLVEREMIDEFSTYDLETEETNISRYTSRYISIADTIRVVENTNTPHHQCSSTCMYESDQVFRYYLCNSHYEAFKNTGKYKGC